MRAWAGKSACSWVSIALAAMVMSFSGAPTVQAEPGYQWSRVSAAAPFPKSYNFPVHVDASGGFIALHPRGTWASSDGQTWTKSPLPFSGMNSAYLPYVSHEGTSWALGLLQGNYTAFTIDPLVQVTRDHKRWISVGRSSTLPKVIFAASASFRGALWLMGGYDGTAYHRDVWNSADGLHWSRVAEAPWSARAAAKAVVFRQRLFLIGGGVIDGASANDVWSTADGIQWRQETSQLAPEEPVGFSPVVYDDAIWLVGANRSGRFASEMLVSRDGRNWTPTRAPWSPRGGVAAWSDGDALFITGGKYSFVKDGETRFEYSNDVWKMTRQR